MKFNRKLTFDEQAMLTEEEKSEYYLWLFEGPVGQAVTRKYERMKRRDEGLPPVEHSCQGYWQTDNGGKLEPNRSTLEDEYGL